MVKVFIWVKWCVTMLKSVYCRYLEKARYIRIYLYGCRSPPLQVKTREGQPVRHQRSLKVIQFSIIIASQHEHD
jgi:hypothetical protein